MPAVDIKIAAQDGGWFGAYLARPRDDVARPAIIVLQEIFGVNAFVRGVVDRLAEAGYLAVAPDLFWRLEPEVELDATIPADRDKAVDLMKRLDETKALADLASTLAYLRGRSDCTGKVGALGYCLGGKFAYLLAARTDIEIAVSYYGVAIQGALHEAANIRKPLLLHIAGADHLCPPEAQQAIADTLGPRGVRIETYAGAGHGFARGKSPAFEEAHAERADALTLAFLREHLDGVRDA